MDIPYSAKFWRGKTLATLVNRWPFANILPCQIHLNFFEFDQLSSLQSSLGPMMVQVIDPPRQINKEHIVEMVQGTCPTVTFPDGDGFRTATVKVSCGLLGSLSHGRFTLSTAASQISMYL